MTKEHSDTARRNAGRSGIGAGKAWRMFATGLLMSAALCLPRAASAAEALRLYTLDCGRLDFTDMGPLADTGEYAGKPGTMAVPCFLIQHGKDWMLWDAGLGDDIAAIPGGKMHYGFKWTVEKTLRSQLAQLGLKPDDIRYVGLSHLHADHSGNVGMFRRSTFLVSPIDVTWGSSLPTPPTADPALVRIVRQSHIEPVRYDRDVFGDGSVLMLRAPGHSPGHHVLELKLANSGAVLLSGDLYHTRQAYEQSLVPSINESRADTLASMLRFRRIAEADHARVVIQHAPSDFAGMPAFPAFLD
jgi:N-acyl homoserine lactone hydrolase